MPSVVFTPCTNASGKTSLRCLVGNRPTGGGGGGGLKGRQGRVVETESDAAPANPTSAAQCPPAAAAADSPRARANTGIGTATGSTRASVAHHRVLAKKYQRDITLQNVPFIRFTCAPKQMQVFPTCGGTNSDVGRVQPVNPLLDDVLPMACRSCELFDLQHVCQRGLVKVGSIEEQHNW